MFRCDDTARLLAFFLADPVRFRHLLHDLDSPCPAWDEAMGCVDYVSREGGFIMRDAQPAEERVEREYYVDSLEEISLVAQVRGRHVRVEGCMTEEQASRFVAWCRGRGIEAIETWSETVHDRLSAAGLSPWKLGGGEYTTSGPQFQGKIEHLVRRLTAGDEGIWRAFVERNASDPMVNARPGGQAAVRDFVFMCKGLPVDYYAAIEEGEIAGVAGVNPMTRTVDEIGMLFVEPRHRRKGYARSLMTAATQDILSRGRLPVYAAGGNPSERPDLHAMLTGLGYRLVVCARQTRLAGCTPS